MKKKHTHSLIAAVTAPIAMLLGTSAAHAAWTVNLTPGVDAVSRHIYELHMLIFWICVGIAVVVFGFIIYSMIRFRQSRSPVADVNLLHNTRVEIIWTLLPALILVSMAVPAARVLIEAEDTSGAQLSIRVTGYQWRWVYEYVGTGVSLISSLDRDSDAARQLGSTVDPFSIPNYLLSVDHPLVVPAGIKVRLLITGGDVIHSWWLPDFGIKKDAIPGYINEVWFNVDADKVGTYRGQCAELCGRDHGFMPIVVQVVTQSDFQKWLKSQQAATSSNPTPGALAAPAAPAESTPPAPTPSTT